MLWGVNCRSAIKEKRDLGVYLRPKVLTSIVSECPENALQNGWLKVSYLLPDTLLDNSSNTLLDTRYLD